MPSKDSGPRAGEEVARFVEAVRQAFAWRRRPGKGDITHCSYDKKYGGQYDGPCLECVQMARFFAGKHWSELTARALKRDGDATALFTVEAYCFLLPAYLIAAVTEPETLDTALDGLTYHFGPRPDDEWGQERLRAILAELRDEELAVLLRHFERELAKDFDFDDFCQRSINGIGGELERRTRQVGGGT